MLISCTLDVSIFLGDTLMIRDNIDVKRSIDLAKTSIQEAYQGRYEIEGYAEDPWNSLVEADLLSCYAH